MCGRYTLTSGPGEIDDRFGARLPGVALGRYNVAPTETIAIVAAQEPGARSAHAVRWGIEPPWRRGGPLINARSETVAGRHPFARLVSEPASRCLIPADGFYEWLRAEEGRQPRRPFHFTLADREPFVFAGLWDGEAATILTTAPNELVARLHDRMPVILQDQGAERAWLEDDLIPEELPSLLSSLDAVRMRSRPASTETNKAGTEGKHLLEPQATDQQPTLF
ncbi:MAG: SOS response-associated peptidase [Solirubrobacteraceae bacterium MAG38_C4-C5]|nr:SOS response-associated peptidase [Candidatus Siliceabacter maunaloa]